MPSNAGRRGWLLAAGVASGVLAIAGALWIAGVFGGDDPVLAPAEIADSARSPGGPEDPFAFTAERSRDLVERATLGYSHVIYEKSPGGVVASARRTAAWRDEIERAASEYGADPDLMEAIVLLESAGRPEVIAGDDPENASGLAQIVASTGIDLLGMRIDLPRSQQFTRQLRKDEAELAQSTRRVNSPTPKVRAKAREARAHPAAQDRGAAAPAPRD